MMSIRSSIRNIIPSYRVLRGLDKVLDNRFRMDLKIGRHLLGPKMALDLNATPAQFNAMLNDVAKTWKHLGETEPHWSVLTDDRFKQDQINQSQEEFYATGKNDIALIRSFFERNGEDLGAVGTVVELGCGVGRVTSHLASLFPKVIGIDISSAHLKVAGAYFQDKGLKNAETLLLERPEDIRKLSGYDLFFSAIALQHNPPPIIDLLLREILAVAHPGGYVLFQVPTYSSNYSFDIKSYSSWKHTEMEMHPLPQRRIFKLLHEADFELIEVHEDGMTGYAMFSSHTFFARKRSAIE